jgi:hypothetical protein
MYEFDRFVEWMNEQVRERISEEIIVQKPLLSRSTFGEKWYRHIESGEVYRLAWPDPPFTGLFKKVV